MSADVRGVLRWGIVGVASNAAGYLVYLGLTALGVAPKLAMTVLYACGVAIGFAGNHAWAFEHGESVRRTLPRYLLAHAFGYALNFAMLWWFHDRLRIAHQLVQAVAILVVAVVLYLLMRSFVFPARAAAGQTR
jgi:putative flippase GtrA